jgi:hypothetical protein
LSTFQASFSEKNSIRVTPYDHISVAVEDLEKKLEMTFTPT